MTICLIATEISVQCNLRETSPECRRHETKHKDVWIKSVGQFNALSGPSAPALCAGVLSVYQRIGHMLLAQAC